MTRYEVLIHKAELCRQAAFKTTDKNFSNEWLKKAVYLEAMAANLPTVKAQQQGLTSW